MFRIIVFGIAAIMTPCLGGCVWLSQSAHFKEPGPFGFSGPALHGYVATNWGHTHGLYLLWAHSWTEPPHSLHFHSEETSGEVVECVITELAVTYSKDDVPLRPAKLPISARYEPKPTYADGTDVRYAAKFSFPGLIDREESFTLTVEGYYLMRDGSRRPFKSKEYFEVSRDPLVRPISFLWAEV